MASTLSNVFSSDELNYINNLPEVLNAKARLSSDVSETSDKVYFKIPLTDEIRQVINEKLSLDLSAVEEIPMRWIKGDTVPHVDSGSSAFERTYLVYMNDSAGEFILGDDSYPITANSAFVFNEGLSHKTLGTGTEPRLLLGPMNEFAQPVGAPPVYAIKYYTNHNDATNKANMIAAGTSYAVGNSIATGSIGSYTFWKIALVERPVDPEVDLPDIYQNGADLVPIDNGTESIIHVYAIGTVQYYSNYTDASANTNVIAEGGYTLGQNIFKGSIGSYTAWRVASIYLFESSPPTGVYNNGYDISILTGGGGVIFYVYPEEVTIKIIYYANYTDASANTNPIAEGSTYIIGGNLTTGSIGTYFAWRVLNAATIDVYSNGTNLDPEATYTGVFYLYPGGPIQYYSSYVDKATIPTTNPIAEGGYTLGQDIIGTGSIGSYTAWRVGVARNSESGVAPGNEGLLTDVYNNGYDFSTILVSGISVFFYVYPEVSCFLEGTKILCLVEGVETELPVESLKAGDLVKTSRDGYKSLVLIGKGQIQNPGTDERTENRLYKCSRDEYPELNEDLFITGCHSILVDRLTTEQREKTEKQLGRIFVTDKKYRLMACIDERAEPWNSEGEYTIWHFALENEEEKQNYGVYANGLLVETCSIFFLKNKSNMTFV